MGYQRSKHLLAFVFATVVLPPLAVRGQEAADIRDPVHRVTFRIPPPPSDAELERPAR